jgi:hypothetical protein
MMFVATIHQRRGAMKLPSHTTSKPDPEPNHNHNHNHNFNPHKLQTHRNQEAHQKERYLFGQISANVHNGFGLRLWLGLGFGLRLWF